MLPPGWKKAVDPETGADFYVNEVTGETQWESPSAAGTPPPPPPAPPGGASSEFVLGMPEWTQEVDPSTGTQYWFNGKTGESSWTKPAGLA